MTLALSALLTMGLLTACGGKTTDKTVDLTAFYNTLAEEYGWAEDAASSGEEDIMMMNLEGDMLEGSYPGLADVATKQLIAKAPMISAVVNEIVLAECGTEGRTLPPPPPSCRTGWTPRQRAAPGIRSPWRPGPTHR